MRNRRRAPGLSCLVPGICCLGSGLAGEANAQRALEMERLPAHARAPLSIEQLAPARRTGRIVVTLPGGETLRLIPQPVERSIDGTRSVAASDGENRLLLTTDGTRAYGHAVAGGRTYLVETHDRALAIVDADRLTGPPAAAMPGWLDDVVPGRTEYQSLQGTPDTRKSAVLQSTVAASPDAFAIASAPSTVDVAMFVETVLETRYGTQAVRTRAQAWIDFTNAAFARNGIALTLRLVYLGPYYGALPSGTGDVFGAFEGNSVARETATRFGADLRHLVYSQDTRPGLDNCGRANLLGDAGASGFECGQHIFAHEIGHNFGAHHDRANVVSPAPSAGAYNFGYVCGGRGTLMSYAGAASLDHYSSPDLAFAGQACGVAIGQPDAAYNGAAIEENRAAVQAFRTPQPIFGGVRFAQDLLTADERGTPVPFSIVRDGDLSRAASVEVGLIDGTGTEGEDVRPLLQVVSFAPGESTRTLLLEPLDDDAFDGAGETLRAVLRYPHGLVVTGAPLEIVLTGDDDPDRGKATFAAAGVSVRENVGNLRIEVGRVGSTAQALTVTFVAEDETARNGTHYRLADGALTFEAGQAQATIDVRIIDNAIFEGVNASRHFSVRLTGPNLGATRDVRVFVYDDDTATPTASVEDNSGESGGGGTHALLLLVLGMALALRMRRLAH